MISWLKNIFSKKHKKRVGNILASTTTVIAVRFESDVVMGTDGRVIASEFGLVVGENTDKIVRIGEDIAIGCSGDAIFIETLNKCLEKDLIRRGINVNEVDVAEVVRNVKFLMEKHSKLHATEVAVLVVGFKNNSSSIIKLETAEYSREVFVTTVDDDVRYETVGSGGPCAETYLKRHMGEYPLNTVEIERRRQIVFDALKCAVKKDWGSGGKLHVVSVDGKDRIPEVFQSQEGGGSCCEVDYKPCAF